MTLSDYLTLPYKLVIIPDPYEGGFVAEWPELKGCLTCGETIDEVLKNAVDAKKCWLEACLEDGINIPLPAAMPANPQTKIKSTPFVSAP